MLNTLWAIVREGKIELLEEVEVPEGTKVLVTLLPEDKAEFWLKVSQISLDRIWDNTKDNVYEKLLVEYPPLTDEERVLNAEAIF